MRADISLVLCLVAVFLTTSAIMKKDFTDIRVIKSRVLIQNKKITGINTPVTLVKLPGLNQFSERKTRYVYRH